MLLGFEPPVCSPGVRAVCVCSRVYVCVRVSVFVVWGGLIFDEVERSKWKVFFV